MDNEEVSVESMLKFIREQVITSPIECETKVLLITKYYFNCLDKLNGK